MGSLPLKLSRREENLFLWEVLKKLVDEAGGSVTVNLRTGCVGEINITPHENETVTISTKLTN